MRKAIAIGSMVLALGAASGCVVEGVVTTSRAVVVAGPPPAPVRETRPAPPGPHAMWIEGYWHWTGMQYTWIPGHWDEAHAGARWQAPRYSFHEGTYFYEPGTWQMRTQ